MNINSIYKKIQEIIAYIDKELDKPISIHSYETRIWGSGYNKGMKSVKKLILDVFTKFK